MEEFFKNYGFIILMLVICVGSHFFMGHGGHKGHGSKKDK